MESEVIIKENTLDSFPSDVRTRIVEGQSLKNEKEQRNDAVTVGRRNNGIGDQGSIFFRYAGFDG